jgi:hypothetical protein
MQKRGVLYMLWGDKAKQAQRHSFASLKKFHPDLPVEIIELQSSDPVKSLLEKARMMSLSPFEETLYLDVDTTVMDNLDFGFEKAAKFGLACCICESPWAKRYHKNEFGDAIEYNTGVLFFSKLAKPLFDKWQELAPVFNSQIIMAAPQGPGYMPHNDQGSFAAAVELTGINPFVLPLNWNFRIDYMNQFVGPLKIWHSYMVPNQAIYDISDYYRTPRSIIQFHTIT